MSTQVTINSFKNVDLEGQTLVSIPIAAHKNTKKVVSLKLSGNPMLKIPLNFFQSCTSLLNLCLSYMTLKSVPKSIYHALSLWQLNFSSNCLSTFEEASLNWNAQLQMLCLQNNWIDSLPWYFPWLRGLTTLNISNNKFRALLPVLCMLEALADLDISFNMISCLLDKIGHLPHLAWLIVVGNQIVSLPDKFRNLGTLRKMDVHWNCITALGSAVMMLGNLKQLLVDHNAVQAQSCTWAPGLPLCTDIIGCLACKALKPQQAHSITSLRLGTPMHLTHLDPCHTQLPWQPQPIGIPHLL
ncbi:hypothetical protein H0H87_008903 [Tephrocybe sp. NHM501043]|nr:hypothetical protein H0H87_008903 [Tephrocybe sp. NHM501043]